MTDKSKLTTDTYEDRELDDNEDQKMHVDKEDQEIENKIQEITKGIEMLENPIDKNINTKFSKETVEKLYDKLKSTPRDQLINLMSAFGENNVMGDLKGHKLSSLSNNSREQKLEVLREKLRICKMKRNKK